MSKTMKKHWDSVYSTKQIHQLGWYEPIAAPSLQLIERSGIQKQNPIVDVGSGATTLMNALLDRGYERIYALDISETALEKARSELGEDQASRIHWIVDDITNPTKLLELKDIALWHDRAVLHFFTEEHQRQRYRVALLKILQPGGYAIIAAFAVGGATRCSGLDVRNYDTESLAAFLGSDFRLVESMDYIYQMPSGDLRPYIYTLFKRI